MNTVPNLLCTRTFGEADKTGSSSVWNEASLVAMNSDDGSQSFKDLPLLAAFSTRETSDFFIKVGKSTAICLCARSADDTDKEGAKFLFKKASRVIPCDVAVVLTAVGSKFSWQRSGPEDAQSAEPTIA